jgi:hypothetical protein
MLTQSHSNAINAIGPAPHWSCGCSHSCRDRVSGYVCYCNPGMCVAVLCGCWCPLHVWHVPTATGAVCGNLSCCCCCGLLAGGVVGVEPTACLPKFLDLRGHACLCTQRCTAAGTVRPCVTTHSLAAAAAAAGADLPRHGQG